MVLHRQFPQVKDFSKLSISSFLNSRVNLHPQRVCQRHPPKAQHIKENKLNIQAREKAETLTLNSNVVWYHTHIHHTPLK